MRHLKLSIEGEIIRAIEGVDLRETSPCSRDQNEFIVPFFHSVRDRSFASRGRCAGGRRKSKLCSRTQEGMQRQFLLTAEPGLAILSLPVHVFQVSRRSRARTGIVVDYDAYAMVIIS
jgi:hypothetical protein